MAKLIDRAISIFLGATLLVTGVVVTPQYIAHSKALNESYQTAFREAQACSAPDSCESVLLISADEIPDHYLGERYLAESARDWLDAHPTIHQVCLNSGGGDMNQGIELANLITTRHLDTCVSELYRFPDKGLVYMASHCDSACTIAFAAGRQRIAYQPDIAFGFHEVNIPVWESFILRYRARSLMGQLGREVDAQTPNKIGGKTYETHFTELNDFAENTPNLTPYFLNATVLMNTYGFVSKTVADARFGEPPACSTLAQCRQDKLPQCDPIANRSVNLPFPVVTDTCHYPSSSGTDASAKEKPLGLPHAE